MSLNLAKQTTKNQQHYLKPEIRNGREFSIFGVFSILGSIHLSGCVVERTSGVKILRDNRD